MEGIKKQIEGSNAYWDKHFSMNNWTLEKPYFQLGSSWRNDKSGRNIYGWVEEITYGKEKGKYRAGCPVIPYRDKDGEYCDAIEIGIFSDVKKAMSAVLENNHPDYSGTYC